VTLSGIVTLAKVVQLANAFVPMQVTGKSLILSGSNYSGGL
jgi:hypothetical protein